MVAKQTALAAAVAAVNTADSAACAVATAAAPVVTFVTSGLQRLLGATVRAVNVPLVSWQSARLTPPAWGWTTLSRCRVTWTSS